MREGGCVRAAFGFSDLFQRIEWGARVFRREIQCLLDDARDDLAMSVGDGEHPEEVAFSEEHFDGGDVLFGNDSAFPQADEVPDGEHHRDDGQRAEWDHGPSAFFHESPEFDGFFGCLGGDWGCGLREQAQVDKRDGGGEQQWDGGREEALEARGHVHDDFRRVYGSLGGLQPLRGYLGGCAAEAMV